MLAAILAGAVPVPARASDPVTFGGELRLRAEAFDNPLDLDRSRDDSYQFYRMRYRISADARPRDGLRLYFRLGNEYRWGVHASGVREGAAYEAAGIRDAESRISLDNGWAELTVPRLANARFRFGRMDLPYGEGFLVFDGTPFDGSSSMYFDAVRASWLKGPAGPEQLGLDLFMAKIQDEGFGTRARDEDLFGLYARRAPLDLYLLHRDKRGETRTSSGVIHPSQYTTALGGRFAHLPEAGGHVAVEGAVQRGLYRDQDPSGVDQDSGRLAYGGYARGGWTGAGAIHPGFEAGGLYLSGDDPDTGTYEGWDGFYSEWPKYSDLLVYTLYDNTSRLAPDPDLEGRRGVNEAGTWANLAALWLEGRIRPRAWLRVSARGTLFQAPEEPPSGCAVPGGGSCSGRNGRRGIIYAGQFDLAPAAGVSAQILGEYFDPGGFYTTSAGKADAAWYGRCQITAGF